jgi:hypothetical protein
MKTLILLLISPMMTLSSSMLETNFPKTENKSFKQGEKLRYRVSYGAIDAGEVVLEVKETKMRGNDNRKLFHAVGVGRTLGAFNAFYRVYDVYETFIDQESIMPWFFRRRVDEGGYKINQDYEFLHHRKLVDNGKGKKYVVPIGIQDMISSFYFARTLNFSTMKIGDVSEFKCFMDEEIFPLKIRYVGKETIKLRSGKIECLKFKPVVQTGRYFNSDEDVVFWITNDHNRIPVMVKAKIPVGSVKMHLVEWSGLQQELVLK